MKILFIILLLAIAAPAQLKPNQAIIEANVEISATLFNHELIIDVLKVKGGRASIVIHCDRDTRIEDEKAGYEITIQQYRIKIQEVKTNSVVFFVERLETVITWGCAIRPATDKVEDFLTLDCKERADETKTFPLYIPKTTWPKEWGTFGAREFVYGIGEEGHRFAVRTKPTHCDMEFDAGGDRNQNQLCGIMFPKDRELIVR